MDSKRRITLLAAAMLALVLLAGCGADEPDAGLSAGTPDNVPAEEAQPAENPQDGQEDAGFQLASFTADTLDGETFTQDGLSGRDVTIINFWATFCGPCVNEMPDLAAYAKALPDHVQLITVCLDGVGKEQDAQDILQQAGYEGITLLAGDGDFKTLCDAVQSLPTTVFLDSEGSLSGGAVIGGQKDLAASFTAAVNQVLTAEGKAEIRVEIE